MTIPNKTTPAIGEHVSNSDMTNFRPNQPNCLPQIPSGAFFEYYQADLDV
jgi:hypothetical protein